MTTHQESVDKTVQAAMGELVKFVANYDSPGDYHDSIQYLSNGNASYVREDLALRMKEITDEVAKSGSLFLEITHSNSDWDFA